MAGALSHVAATEVLFKIPTMHRHVVARVRLSGLYTLPAGHTRLAVSGPNACSLAEDAPMRLVVEQCLGYVAEVMPVSRVPSGLLTATHLKELHYGFEEVAAAICSNAKDMSHEIFRAALGA
jgi:hypothetical protein